VIRVLIADDHRLVRAGIRKLVEGFGGYQVVGEADHGRDAVRMARDLAPHVILLDLAMPELNGMDALARIRRQAPEARVIVVSMHASARYARAALAAGAHGYVVKDAASTELAKALSEVAGGGLHPGSLPGEAPEPEPEPVLTGRQREVLQLLAEGYSTRETAERLFLSVKTVETHRSHIMARLDIGDVASLTRYAISIGLVQVE
jgi:DNA-binding NarL/FixJ family response regulator